LQPVIFATEDSAFSIGSEHWNSKWIRECYGDEVPHHLKHSIISCSGTTLGPINALLAYLNDICFEISRTEFSCNDQGNHNYVVHHKYLHLKLSSFRFVLEPNAISPLYTVGLMRPSSPPFHWNGSHIVRTGSPRPVAPVIHQLQSFQQWNNVLTSLGLMESVMGSAGRTYSEYSWLGPPYICLVGCGDTPFFTSSIGRSEIKLPSSYTGVKVQVTFTGFQFCLPELVHGRSMWTGSVRCLSRTCFCCWAELRDELWQVL
jgi:hypothetical protein